MGRTRMSPTGSNRFVKLSSILRKRGRKKKRVVPGGGGSPARRTPGIKKRVKTRPHSLIGQHRIEIRKRGPWLGK